MTITKEVALSLRSGTILHHTSFKNRDGTPARFRVSGKCRTWKTRPTEWYLPVKHGLRTHFRITPEVAGQFEIVS
jgi:hypothetical protein